MEYRELRLGAQRDRGSRTTVKERPARAPVEGTERSLHMIHPSGDDCLWIRGLDLPGERARANKGQWKSFGRRSFGRKEHAFLSNQPAEIYEIVVGLRLGWGILAAFDVGRKTMEG